MKHDDQTLADLMHMHPKSVDLLPSTDFLPSDPVDGFTLTLWGSDRLAPNGARRYQWVYRKDASWKDVFPEDQSREGCSFHDEWMVYKGEEFVGRIEGWARVLDFLPRRRLYMTEAAAQRASVLWLLDHVAELREERRETLRQFDVVLKQIPKSEWPECPECDGSGDVMERLTCPSCQGNGRLIPRIGDC